MTAERADAPLQRWTVESFKDAFPEPDGEWVRWSDVQARLSESAQQPSLAALVPAEFQQLAMFYGVDSLEELVRIQAHHVERLQKKLPPIPDQFPRTPREG